MEELERQMMNDQMQRSVPNPAISLTTFACFVGPWKWLQCQAIVIPRNGSNVKPK